MRADPRGNATRDLEAIEPKKQRLGIFFVHCLATGFPQKVWAGCKKLFRTPLEGVWGINGDE